MTVTLLRKENFSTGTMALSKGNMGMTVTLLRKDISTGTMALSKGNLAMTVTLLRKESFITGAMALSRKGI